MRNRILGVGVMLLLAATLASAGGDHAKGAKMTPAEKAAMLQEKLGLTDAQTQQVQALMEETFARYDQLKSSGLEGDALKAEKQKLHEQYDAKLRKILTTEQWAKYEQMRAEYKKQEGAKKQ